MKNTDTNLTNLIDRHGSDTYLRDLPETELERGLAIQQALGRHGYDESAHKVIGDLGLWDTTLGEFAKQYA